MAKKKAPPRHTKSGNAPAVTYAAEDAIKRKTKASKKKAKREPSVARGGCSTALMKWGHSYKAADKVCEADGADHTAFGQAGGQANATRFQKAPEKKKKKVVRIGKHVMKV